MRTLFYNGRVFTGCGEMQQAFFVENGCFSHVGTDQQMLALAWAGDELVNLNGAFVCPGFNDSHMHLLNLGNAMAMCNLAGAESLAALQQRLCVYLQENSLAPGEWLLGRGWNQDLFSPATGMPTRWDLDKVSTRHPICIVRCCGHALSVNSLALEMLQLNEHTPCPPGGTLEKDSRGRLTGILLDGAMPLVQGRLPVPGVPQLKNMLRAAMRRLNKTGVTSCHSDDLITFDHVPWQDVLAAYQELDAAGEMTVRVYQQCQFTAPEALQAFLDTGLNTGAGTPFFKIGPLKMLGDGSLGARTAFLRDGYADAPGEHGLVLFTQEQFDQMISLAHRNGMQCAIHVIGDGVLDRVLAAYEKAFAAHPRPDHRSGLIHVQLTRPDQLEKIRALSLHAYVQTVFLDYDSHIVHARAGSLADTSYAFRTLLEKGVSLSNGTDCPVEDPNPFRGIQCAVTRRPLDGSLPPYRPEEKLTVEEALLSYTAAGARASFEENVKGKIAPGMAADFALLSANPFLAAPETLSAITVQALWLNGRPLPL